MLAKNTESIEPITSPKLIDYYENKIKGKMLMIKKLTNEMSILKSNYEVWDAFLRPNLRIKEIYPEVRKDKNGFKPKPYYRASASFPYEGKKNQIVVYVGTIEEFKEDFKYKQLEKIAIHSIQKSILKNYPLALNLEYIEKCYDIDYEEKHSSTPPSKRAEQLEKYKLKHRSKKHDENDSSENDLTLFDEK